MVESKQAVGQYKLQVTKEKKRCSFFIGFPEKVHGNNPNRTYNNAIKKYRNPELVKKAI